MASLILLFGAIWSVPGATSRWGMLGFAAVYAVAAIVWLVSVPRAHSWRFGVVIAIAIALRLPMLLAPPQLSHDMYRYVWDGRVLASGVNPYRYAPDDPRLAQLRTSWHARINHPHIPTIYPPHAELLFAAVHHPVAWRLLVIAAEVAALFVLRRHGRILMPLATFPPLIIESAWSGHIEAVAALLLLVAFVRGSGTLAALATGMKIIPIAAVPALWHRATTRWRFAAAFALALLLPVVPFALAGPLMPGMRDYARRWVFNSPLYSASFAAIGESGAAGRLKDVWTRIKDPLHLEIISPVVYEHLYTDFLSRALLAVAASLAIVVMCRMPGGAVHGVGVLLLCSPAIHPWYWIALVPLAFLTNARGWLALALCAPFSYLLYEGAPPMLVFALCYGAPLFYLAASALRERDMRR